MRGPGVAYVPETEKEKLLRYSAQMTQNQFRAIQCRCQTKKVIEELATLDYLNRIHRARNATEGEIEKWLKNGWNTENLLRSTQELFDENSLIFAVQWAFPQLYYSVFSTILAFFVASGNTERTHAAVIKKMGSLIRENNYPSSLSFLADGGIKDIQISGVTVTPGYESIQFDVDNEELIENQIFQFLRSTRKIDLNNRKKSIRIRNASDSGYKTNFSSHDWGQVSTSLGLTSILSLIYRKRIKSNYRDIDTFLSEHLNADNLFDAFIQIADTMNLIHETFIAKAIGWNRYQQMIEELDYQFLNDRAGIVSTIIS